MHAADALDQRRLARAVVAEQRQHLAAVQLEVDAVEREDRAEALGGAAHGERRRASEARSRAGRLAAPGTGSRACRGTTSSSTASTMTTPMTIGCRNASTFSRFMPLRITPIISAPTSALATLPRPPRKLAPPITTAAIASSSARSPKFGEPALSRPEVMIAADPGRQPAQHVDGDEHRSHRDGRRGGRPPGCRRPRRSSDPTPGGWSGRRRAAPVRGRGTPSRGASRSSRRRWSGRSRASPACGCPPDSHSASPRAMLSVARVMMKGWGSLPLHVDHAVDRADGHARAPA